MQHILFSRVGWDHGNLPRFFPRNCPFFGHGRNTQQVCKHSVKIRIRKTRQGNSSLQSGKCSPLVFWTEGTKKFEFEISNSNLFFGWANKVMVPEAKQHHERFVPHTLFYGLGSSSSTLESTCSFSSCCASELASSVGTTDSLGIFGKLDSIPTVRSTMY